jgi:hypothetical protein
MAAHSKRLFHSIGEAKQRRARSMLGWVRECETMLKQLFVRQGQKVHLFRPSLGFLA